MDKTDYNEIRYNKYLPKIRNKVPTSGIRRLLMGMLKLIKNGNEPNQVFNQIKQQFGLNISATLLKDRPVNIINIQNANVGEITIGLVEAFDQCDDLDDKFKNIAESLNLLEASEIFVKKCIESKMTYQEFQNYAASRYVSEVIEMNDTKTEAAKFLDMQRTYLSRLEREFKEKQEGKEK